MTITITGRITQTGKSIILPVSIILDIGDVGIFAGGTHNNANISTIDYIIISTPGNAADFGDLTEARGYITGASNGTNDRGVFSGGGQKDFEINTVDYVTISAQGNALDFGDMITGEEDRKAGTSNGTDDRGVFAGGGNGAVIFIAAMDYITISSTGNVTTFGTLSQPRNSPSGTSNGVNERGIFGGGNILFPDAANRIDQITISTTGNAVSRGDLTQQRYAAGACSNGTNNRGVFAGGQQFITNYNIMDYVTITTNSNATDFGDIAANKRQDGLSNATNERGVFGGMSNIIGYITISSPSNSLDFGDLTTTQVGSGAVFNA